MSEDINLIEQKAGGLTGVDIYEGIRDTLAIARTKVKTAINVAMVEAYWDIGRQIEENIGSRAEYGKGLIAFLSLHLTQEFGKGFTERNLRAMRQFFVLFPIRHSLRAELSWTHYRLLMRINNITTKLKQEIKRERELIELQQMLREGE